MPKSIPEEKVVLGGGFLNDGDLQIVGFRQFGQNVQIHERASIYGPENIIIGDNVRIDDFTVINAVRGPLSLGSYVHIACHCCLVATHGIVMEDFSGLSSGVRVYSSSDDYSGERLTNPTVPRKYSDAAGGLVRIGRHVIVGAGSIILPGCIIGQGAAVGAMSLVNKDLEPWGIYAGIPVRRIKDRKQDLLKVEEELHKSGDPL